MRLAMIADDLTGANDSGVQLAHFGLTTSVLFHMDKEALRKSDAIAVDTDSRSLSHEEAYRKVKEAAEFIKEVPFDIIFKKVDSTLRGNLGAEIDAIYDVFQPDLVVIAPAYPKNGRKTINGYHYLGEQLVSETEIARDPKTPVRESFIPKLLESQTKRKIGLITQDDLDLGSDHVQKKLSEMNQAKIPYIVFDAKAEDDLEKLSQYVHQSPYTVCWVGSAGLANYLPEMFGLQPVKKNVEIPKNDDLVITVVGSVSPTSRKQLEATLDHPKIKGVEVHSASIVSDQQSKETEINQAYVKALNYVKAKYSIVLYSSGKPEDIRQAKEIGKKHGLNDREVSNQISQALGEIAARLVQGHRVKGLVLTGGDTAKQVCNQLGITGFKLIDEVETGIPLGIAVGRQEMFAITKAGAFGTEHSLLHSIKKLQGENM